MPRCQEMPPAPLHRPAELGLIPVGYSSGLLVSNSGLKLDTVSAFHIYWFIMYVYLLMQETTGHSLVKIVWIYTNIVHIGFGWYQPMQLARSLLGFGMELRDTFSRQRYDSQNSRSLRHHGRAGICVTLSVIIPFRKQVLCTDLSEEITNDQSLFHGLLFVGEY